MDYKYYIDTEKIECEIRNFGLFSFRRVIKIPFNDATTINKKAVFIMMNPSKANGDESDITVDRILAYAHDRSQYSEVVILNTISLYDSNSNSAKQSIKKAEDSMGKKAFKEEQNLNIEVIEKVLKNLCKDDDVYMATGNPLPTYGTTAIKKIYDCFCKNKSVFSFKSVREDSTNSKKTTVRGFTFHPSRQHDSFFEENNKFDFIITGYGNKRTRINDANIVRSLVRIQQEPYEKI